MNNGIWGSKKIETNLTLQRFVSQMLHDLFMSRERMKTSINVEVLNQLQSKAEIDKYNLVDHVKLDKNKFGKVMKLTRFLSKEKLVQFYTTRRIRFQNYGK